MKQVVGPINFAYLKKYIFPNCVMPIKCAMKFKVLYLLIAYISIMIPITLFTAAISKANYLLRLLKRKSFILQWKEIKL